MAIMWSQSLTPWTDPNGDPYSGAKAFFFDAGTTTPRTVYRDGALGQAHDHPVVANAVGMFPAIFLPAGDYRVRITTAADVTIWDVDDITTPIITEGGGGGGDTPVELLFRTGDYKFRHGTGTQSGWVRANGRTIGSGSSGATERANADCEDLFTFLWNQDSTLVVSGGRGANAASDWAGGKNIALPDMRLRALIGMKSMGASASTLFDAVGFDGGETGDTLGATSGAATVTLEIVHMPPHDHGGQVGPAGSHAHTVTTPITTDPGPGFASADGVTTRSGSQVTSTAPNHQHPISSQGGGAGHANVQPSAVATCYLKL